MKHHHLFLVGVMLSILLGSCTKDSSKVDSLGYQLAGTDIIVDASDFLDQIPRLHLVQDARSLGVDWLYNDFAIQFRTHANFTISNYFKDVTFPADGTYYLYVRAVGRPYDPFGARPRISDGAPQQLKSNGAFRLRVNDSYVEGSFGDELGAKLKRAGSYNVRKGEVAHLMITRMTGSPALDCIVLSQNPNLTEADLLPHQLGEEVTLLHQYTTVPTSCVKFGDITGNGKTDFVAFTKGYSSYAYDNSGKLLWSWDAPAENERLRAEFECPGLLWDFDRDGKAELVQWRESEGTEWLVVANALTGEIISRRPWPTAPHPHVYNNFRLAVANIDGDYPSAILLYSDCGKFMTYGLYDAQLNELWRHEVNTRKDHLGHYFYAKDLTGDGIDEIIGGWRVLDAKGNILWSRLEDIYDNHDHADTYDFEDMNGDGRPEVIIGACDLGAQVRDALTGELLTISPAEHTQQLQAGHFLKDQKYAQIAAGARIYKNRQSDPYISSQVYWYDNQGKLLSRWPTNGLNGNPDMDKGDWFGDGSEVLFWYKFRMQPDGRGKLSMMSGEMYHVLDFERNGAAQVITLQGDKMSVWGYKNVRARKPNNDPNFIKEHIANHTHY